MTLPADMDIKLAGFKNPELLALKHALETARCTTDYERSSRSLSKICKNEDIRKLKVAVHLLQDEIDELNKQLETEEENIEGLEQRLEEAENRANDYSQENNQLSNDLKTRMRELENTRAELAAMQTMSSDSTRILTEKLALARELSVLKPELESLRAQVATNKELLSEKLSLQRQLTTVQVELDNANRTTQRALAKAGTSNHNDSAFESQIEELQMQLREAKLAQRESKREIEQLKDQLSKAQKAAEKVERVSVKQVKIDDGGAERFKDRIDELRKELTAEKREKSKLERSWEQEKQTWEAQKSLLDDKLNQFRTKLRSTKDKLKDAEEQLEKMQEATAVAMKPSVRLPAPKAAKNPRKRGASQISMDPETIGTPGDGPPAKRGKRNGSLAPTMPGDKSTFSITPFLNRTVVSLAPDTPEAAAAEEEPKKAPEPVSQTLAEVQDSPSAAPARKGTKKATKSKALALAGTGKHNAKVARRTTASIPSLEKVVEEPSEVERQDDESAKEADPKTAESVASKPQPDPILAVPQLKPVLLKKPRKSLASFASFVDEPAEKRKRRKLGGSGISKTLFDEEEDDKPPLKPIPGRGLFAGKAFGKGGLRKGPLMDGGDGFMFSPLKKDRRALSSGKSLLNVGAD